MKVITLNDISAVSELVSKYVKIKIEKKPDCVGNNNYITNTMDALASSAKAGLAIKPLTTKADVLKRHNSVVDSGVEEFIQDCKDGSKELNAIDDILSMTEKEINGVIFDKRVLRGFGSGKEISSNIVDDLEKVKKLPFDKKSITPTFSSIDEAASKTKVGDVFQIDKQKTVSIKTRTGEIKPLKMTKESYEELFPPVSRYASYQGNYGHCYEVTALNAVMERPEARENILLAIDTVSENGVIKIKLKNSSYEEPIRITPQDLDNPECYTHGCKGLLYIEHALGKEYEKDFITYKIGQLRRQGNLIKALTTEQAFIEGDSKYLAKKFGAKNDYTLGTNLRDGGFAFVPWYKLGFDTRGVAYARDYESSSVSKNLKEYQDYNWADKYFPDTFTEDENSFLEKLWSPEFFKTHLVEASVGDKASRSHLSHDHSYRLSATFDKDGRVDGYLIKDPKGILEERLTIDNILDEIDSISFSKIM